MQVKDKAEAALQQDAAKRLTKNSDPAYNDIVERLKKSYDFIVKAFGEKGIFWFNYTMVRLGLYNYPEGKSEKTKRFMRQIAMSSFAPSLLNLSVLKSVNVEDLPFIKEESDGSVVLGNMVFAEAEFTKIDKKNHRVGGYANTIICDLVDDIFLPEAYEDSAKKLKNTFFMHHRDLPDGTIKVSKFTEIGWYVETEPEPWSWAKVEDGTITGYSVGGYIKMWPEFVGAVAVFKQRGSIVINDLSHVTRPCNKLSVFSGTTKSEVEPVDAKPVEALFVDMFTQLQPTSQTSQSQPTVGTDDTGSTKKQGNEKNLSEDKTKDQPPAEQPVEKEDEVSALLKKRDERVRKQLLKELSTKEEEEEKAQEESRIGKLEKEVGELKGLFNTKIAELSKMLEDAINKIQKIEDAPEAKAVEPAEETDNSLIARIDKNTTQLSPSAAMAETERLIKGEPA